MGKLTNSYNPTVAVDLDGVLAQYTGFRGPEHIEDPIPGAKQFLSDLSEKYTLVVYTARDTAIAREWLEKWDMWQHVSDVNFCRINGAGGKPVAIAYVDDRAVRFMGSYELAHIDVDRLAAEGIKKDTSKRR